MLKNPLNTSVSKFAGALVALAIGVSASAVVTASESNTPVNLAAMLSNGGYVVYVRHTSTEKDYADQISAKLGNCSTQRTLSEKGWNEAEMIGAAFTLLNIPVGAIYSSEYCRAWKTSRIAFGKPIKRSELNFEPYEEYTSEQTTRMRSAVVPMISEIPLDGSNTVIVGHDDPFEAATGIYPEPQGVSYVVKPKGNGEFVVEGFIKPGDWPLILGTAY